MVLAFLGMLCGAFQSTAPAERGPASEELQALAKADQSARQWSTPPSAEVLKAMAVGDRAREGRVRQLLREDKVLTKEDLAAAALIMQHGADPEDYILARELSLLSCFKGGNHSLPALAEDRYLSSIGRKQRFGSQFAGTIDGALKLKDYDNEGPAAVTDALCRDFLVPPISAVRERGMKAFEAESPSLFRRLEERRYNKKWLQAATHWPESREIALLFARSRAGKPVRAALDRILTIYQADRIGPPASLFHAASVLANSDEEQTILLANEMAALAVMRGYGPAKRLFARTWDQFAERIGEQERYGTKKGAIRVCPIVAREFIGRD